MIWLNGENFAAMKRNDLLFGPWAEQTPNFAYVDVEGKPTVINDFTVPTMGLEAPWGMAHADQCFEILGHRGQLPEIWRTRHQHDHVITADRGEAPVWPHSDHYPHSSRLNGY